LPKTCKVPNQKPSDKFILRENLPLVLGFRRPVELKQKFRLEDHPLSLHIHLYSRKH